MDSQDQRAAVLKLTAILRKVTRVIQFLPFIYLVLFSLSSFLEAFVSDECLFLRDSVLAVSPLVNVGFLFFSRVLELCKWHKTSCIIPLSSHTADYVDNYLFQFTQNEVIMLNVVFGLISTLFLILAYKHFFGNELKRPYRRNT